MENYAKADINSEAELNCYPACLLLFSLKFLNI